MGGGRWVLVVGRGVMISYPPLWSFCLSIDSKVVNGIDDTFYVLRDGSFSYGRNNFDYTLLERSLLSLSLMVE